MIKGHGDDIYRCGREITSNFSSNIPAHPLPLALQRHLCSCMAKIASYPEPDARSLAELLAQKNALSPTELLVTNGAVEAIYLIAQRFRGARTTIVIPTFSEYEDACCMHAHRLTFTASISDIQPDAELVWVCNPNNPNGQVYQKAELAGLATDFPNTCFVCDQSYEAFADPQFTFTAAEGVRLPNVILLHSMTKSYGIPGLRLGYVTACREQIATLSAFRMPWSVNTMAIEAGKYVLQHNCLPFDLKSYTCETHRLMRMLNDIDDLLVYPTSTHFFLCELKKGEASALKQYLIVHHGILIRDAANFRGLNERFFRIAAQSPEENDQLVHAIRTWMRSC